MIYRVNKPHYHFWQRFHFIVLRIIFPPILIWNILQVVFNFLLGRWIGRLILTAQKKQFFEFSEDHCFLQNQRQFENNKPNDRLSFEKHQVVTYDGVKLDTLQINHASQLTHPLRHQQYIIHFLGGEMSYVNQIEALISDGADLRRNVIGFDFRGVNRSTGQAQSKDDLVVDGIAQVQRLLDLGVDPQHIILKGHALGAAIATLVAAHFHQNGHSVCLFNGRSFSSISNQVIGVIQQEGQSGHLENKFKKNMIRLVKPLIQLILAMVKWEINALPAFQLIPANYKEYTVVRTRRSQRTEEIKDDAVITQYASLHAALKDERRQEKARINREIDRLDQEIIIQYDKQRPKSNSQLQQLDFNIKTLTMQQDSLIKEKSQFKKRKLEGNDEDAHVLGLDVLYNRFGETGSEFFNVFARRVDPELAVEPHLEMC